MSDFLLSAGNAGLPEPVSPALQAAQLAKKQRSEQEPESFDAVMKLTLADSATPDRGKDEEALRQRELERIHKTAQEFEGQILQMVFKQMWDSVGEDPMLGGGLSSKFYREMWIDEVSDAIARGPGGLGIARMVEREMMPRTLTKPAVKAASPHPGTFVE